MVSTLEQMQVPNGTGPGVRSFFMTDHAVLAKMLGMGKVPPESNDGRSSIKSAGQMV